MTLTHIVDVKEKFELQAYAKPQDVDRHTHIPFSGSPRKHPIEQDRILLIADPFTTNTFYYEFKIADIGFAEELSNMTNIDGDAIPMARIWVRKQSVGVRCTPFIVDAIAPQRP
ncbi:MAG: inorganic pyrophosphatase Ppa [Desulfobacteraceae bacterium]|nr:inorganic pyrophosphatase Ppa [Desulfobacteraceae bacterium]